MVEWRTVSEVDDDDVLVARLRAGDDRALASAYDAHGGAVYAVARRVTLDDQLARDVTQDVFVHLWECPERVDTSRGTVRTYLRVVAHRRAVDVVRRTERRGRAEESAWRSSPDDRVAPPVEDGVADGEAALWSRGIVVDALDQLPAEQRIALMLAYFEGRTLREVAECLGIPEGTAKSRVRLGIAHVRALVGHALEAGR
jgi:RNA polymerase sigma-70 factor (ECF subfamily)